jgi:hypothetical protein
VILGYRRGVIRVWRARGEAYKETVIRRRWKGFTEFMFWGCFSWDSKGPCHIWRTQSVVERKRDDLELAELNERLEATAKAKWELSSGLRRVNLRRNPGGKKL